jgi:hypothetical protein
MTIFLFQIKYLHRLVKAKMGNVYQVRHGVRRCDEWGC